jgi:predicted TIM-barrel fold metal-dependent hydrolase
MNAMDSVHAKTDVPFPPDPNPRTPNFRVPRGSWDTHFHLYGPPHRFPYADTRLRTPPAAPIEHWWSTSAAIGIERGVTVTPGIHGSNNDATLDAIERSEGRLAGMIRSNSELTAADVAGLHRRGVRGMRFAFATRGRDAFDERELWANLANIEPSGWVVALLMDGHVLERHAEVVANLPVPTVIDGFAGISPGRGVDQPAVRTLLDVLRRPNVHLKIMCPDRELHAGERYEDVVALVRAIVATAPDRVMWGSDWPHSYVYEAGKVPNDGDLLGMLSDFVPDEHVRSKILVDNPTRLFGGSLNA